MDLCAIGARIKAAREKAGMTQEDLAAALEMLEREEDDLECGITLYSLLWHPDCAERERLSQELLRRDGFWPSFAYLAAWKDRAGTQ